MTVFSPQSDLAVSILEQRILQVLSKVWINTPVSKSVIRIAGRLISQSSRQAACLLVSGESGVGKTSIIARMKNHAFRDLKSILYIDYDKNVRSEFYAQVARSLEIPSDIVARNNSFLGSEVKRVLNLRGIKAIVIDDFHDILLSQRNLQRPNLAAIRGISDSENPVSIIAFGIESSSIALSTDAQLQSRFIVKSIPSWADGENLRGFLTSYEESLPLNEPSNLWEDRKVRYLLSSCKGNMRAMIITIKHAAIYALCNGDACITLETLKLGHDFPYEQEGWDYERMLNSIV